MIDLNKAYITRDGRKVKLWTTGARDTPPYSVRGEILSDYADWYDCSWTTTGRINISGTDKSDLVEVKPRIQMEVWLNIYPDKSGHGVHRSKEAADGGAMSHRRACIKVTVDCEEGEGL